MGGLVIIELNLLSILENPSLMKAFAFSILFFTILVWARSIARLFISHIDTSIMV